MKNFEDQRSINLHIFEVVTELQKSLGGTRA